MHVHAKTSGPQLELSGQMASNREEVGRHHLCVDVCGCVRVAVAT